MARLRERRRSAGAARRHGGRHGRRHGADGPRALGMMPGAGTRCRGWWRRRCGARSTSRCCGSARAARRRAAGGLAAPLVMVSGAVGGFVGMGGFVPDAAVTTLAIMREIARIAQEQGEQLDDPGYAGGVPGGVRAKPRPCGRVGGRVRLFSARGWCCRAGRWRCCCRTWRAVRADAVAEVRGAGDPGGGRGRRGGVNAAFLAHYRELATAHFTVRRMERVFGADVGQAGGGRLARDKRGVGALRDDEHRAGRPRGKDGDGAFRAEAEALGLDDARAAAAGGAQVALQLAAQGVLAIRAEAAARASCCICGRRGSRRSTGRCWSVSVRALRSGGVAAPGGPGSSYCELSPRGCLGS